MSLPGQEAGSPDLEAGYKFPSLDSLGLQLVTVLDTLHIKQVTWVMKAFKSTSMHRFHTQYKITTLYCNSLYIS